jgi:ABC-type glycerol-3-phosphate transport system permease component
MTETALATHIVQVSSKSVAARRRRQFGRGALYAIATIFAVGFMLPFAWAVFSSFKSPGDLTSYPPKLFPKVWHPENYRTVFQRVPFGRWGENTVLIAVLATVGAVFSSSLVAFSFARFRYPGRDLIFLITLSTMMLPGEVTLIPLYILFAKIGWLDSYRPLIVPSFFGGGAFLIFMMRQFFMTIPLDLDEAARIDGASFLRIYLQIVMPLSVPALATASVLTFIGNWSDFMGPFIILNSREKFTLAVGIRYFQSLADPDGVPTQHLLMASSLMMTLPIIVLFFLAQRFFVRGIVMTGIKG